MFFSNNYKNSYFKKKIANNFDLIYLYKYSLLNKKNVYY